MVRVRLTPGIFGYLNYNKPADVRKIVGILINGLRRLEYRGYDSAGIAVGEPAQIYRVKGKVVGLEEATLDVKAESVNNGVGIAHTRWATHGPPAIKNAHPQSSDETNEFVVVHNGIFTNYHVLKTFLEKHGHKFVSDTDTEVFAKLLKHFYDSTIMRQSEAQSSLLQIVTRALSCIEGSYAVLVKSAKFPGECVGMIFSSSCCFASLIPSCPERLSAPLWHQI